VHLHPRAEKNILGVTYRENFKYIKCTRRTVHHQAKQESILGHFCWTGVDFEVVVVYLVVLDRLLKATTKKGRQNS